MWNAVYCSEWATSYHVNALSFGLLGKDDISGKATEQTITIFAILAVTHYFYHRWMKNGTIYKPEFSIYSAIAYEPSVFDNQETMYLQYLGYVYEDIHPWIESFYVVRY